MADLRKPCRDEPAYQRFGQALRRREADRAIAVAEAHRVRFGDELGDDVARMRVVTAVPRKPRIACDHLASQPETRHRVGDDLLGVGQEGLQNPAQGLKGGALILGPRRKIGIDLGGAHSAAFISKPWAIWSEGATGYSPEKQASQYCGDLASRPAASPTAR